MFSDVVVLPVQVQCAGCPHATKNGCFVQYLSKGTQSALPLNWAVVAPSVAPAPFVVRPVEEGVGGFASRHQVSEPIGR